MTMLRLLGGLVALVLLLGGALSLPAAAAPPSVPAALPAAQAGAATLVHPVAGNWTLLVNLGDAGPTSVVLGDVQRWVSAAFVFDAAGGRFRSFRVGQPSVGDLDTIEAGQAFWVFVPPERLDGDLAFWQQQASLGARDVSLRPGFNLVAWSGSDGVPVSLALAGLPVRRAYGWDLLTQRFRIWSPGLPAALQDDFPLYYGDGLWLELDGSATLTWAQR